MPYCTALLTLVLILASLLVVGVGKAVWLLALGVTLPLVAQLVWTRLETRWGVTWQVTDLQVMLALLTISVLAATVTLWCWCRTAGTSSLA